MPSIRAARVWLSLEWSIAFVVSSWSASSKVGNRSVKARIGRQERVKIAFEASLRRLGTKVINLYTTCIDAINWWSVIEEPEEDDEADLVCEEIERLLR